MADARREPELEACPRLGVAFELLGKRWNALILDVLAQRPARFSEIHRAIPQLSDRMLGARLKELSRVGLVRRSGQPPHYELTEIGEALIPSFDAIRGWSDSLTTTSRAADK